MKPNGNPAVKSRPIKVQPIPTVSDDLGQVRVYVRREESDGGRSLPLGLAVQEWVNLTSTCVLGRGCVAPGTTHIWSCPMFSTVCITYITVHLLYFNRSHWFSNEVDNTANQSINQYNILPLKLRSSTENESRSVISFPQLLNKPDKLPEKQTQSINYLQNRASAYCDPSSFFMPGWQD